MTRRIDAVTKETHARRSQAVELLLSHGWKWDGRQWTTPACNQAAAPTPAPNAGIDGCTESNCRRCLTHPDHRGNMSHAGIGGYPGEPAGDSGGSGGEPKSWFSISKCGCRVTSNRHPWVKKQLSLSGEYVEICEKHKGKPAKSPPAPGAGVAQPASVVASATPLSVAVSSDPSVRVDDVMVDRMIARYLELEPDEKEFAGVSTDHEATRQFCRELLTAALGESP